MMKEAVWCEVNEIHSKLLFVSQLLMICLNNNNNNNMLQRLIKL